MASASCRACEDETCRKGGKFAGSLAKKKDKFEDAITSEIIITCRCILNQRAHLRDDASERHVLVSRLYFAIYTIKTILGKKILKIMYIHNISILLWLNIKFLV